MVAVDADIIIIIMDKPANSTPAEILQSLKSSRKVAICIDSRLDFDAYCSALSFYRFAKKYLGIETDIYSPHAKLPNGYTKVLKEISHEVNDIQFGKDPTSLDFSPYDTLVAIDCAQNFHLSGISEDFELPKINSINIDHHAGNIYYGNFNYVKPYPSATQVLYELYGLWGYQVDEIDANLLFLGLYTDSMFLQLANVNSLTFNVISDLIEIGNINMSELSGKLRRRSLIEVYMAQIVYKNLKIDEKRKMAYSFISSEDLIEYKISLSDLKGLAPINVLSGMDGIAFYFLIKQESPTQFSVSLRAGDDKANVLSTAQHFGGGGHKGSAGCLVTGETEIQEIADTIINKFLETQDSQDLQT